LSIAGWASLTKGVIGCIITVNREFSGIPDAGRIRVDGKRCFIDWFSAESGLTLILCFAAQFFQVKKRSNFKDEAKRLVPRLPMKWFLDL